MKSNIEELIEVMKNPDPSVLYHYASQKGLLEIVNSKTMWATNIYYLNDSLEYEYAAQLIQEVESRQIHISGHTHQSGQTHWSAPTMSFFIFTGLFSSMSHFNGLFWIYSRIACNSFSFRLICS
jgi:hypothetical protein